MKIIHAIPSVAVEAAGTTYACLNMAEAQSQLGAQVELHTLDPVPGSFRFQPTIGYPASRWPVRALGRSPAMLNGLRQACKEAQIIHGHGMWMMPNLYTDAARQGTSCKLVTSTHGMLNPWALRHSAWKKKLMRWFGQNRVLRHTEMFMATAMAEYEDIRRLGYRQPVAVLPLGYVLRPPPGAPVPASGRRRICYLGRIHRIKGLDNLIQAWAALEAKFPDWELALVGPPSDYTAELRQLAGELRCQRVAFVGALFGDAKLDFLRQSHLNVLPSHTENFGMTVLEALGEEIPVIATQGTPWQGLEQHGAGFWIEIGAKPLTETLEYAMSLPPETLAAMGRHGRAWVAEEFSWETIARKTLAAYEWLSAGGHNRPEWVLKD